MLHGWHEVISLHTGSWGWYSPPSPAAMADDGSSSSTENVTYEEHCQNHGYPLSLVREATSVPEGACKYPVLNFAWFVRVVKHSWSVLVRVKMANTGDFLDALLSEWLGAPDYSSPWTSGPPTEHSLVDLVADFDLSLLEPSSSKSLTSSGDSTLFLPRRDSLQVRVSEIEDRLGVFYLSIRGLRSSQVAESMTLACQELLDSLVFRDTLWCPVVGEYADREI